MKKLLLVFGLVCGGNLVNAQDIHFTMFHVAPTVLNPGAAGVFDGTFRASTNFKNQWGSISNAFNTYALTVDAALFKNKWKTAHIGAGLNFYRDVAGTTKFGTTKVDLSVSGILYAADYHTLSLGLMGGWGQSTISPTALQWDSQFDGQEYNGSLPSNENINFQNEDYFDFSTGFMWTYGTEASNLASFDKTKAQVGFAFHHIARPRLLTYFGTPDKLYSRFVLHGDFHIASGSSRLGVRPRFFALFQGPAREINLGLMLRYLVNEGSKYTQNVKGFAISGGAYYRFGDAICPSVEIELAGFSLGFSYDFNISKLRGASGGFGGAEFYLKFQNPNPFFRFSRRPSIR
jgi:type IX secretion system PorP/SprF family membrane protein